MQYPINKGVGKAVEFYGLQAQYIWYLFGGLVANFILFAIIYFIGVPPLMAVGIFLVSTGVICFYIFSMGKKHGEHGLSLLKSRQAQPRYMVVRNPVLFKNLKTVKPVARNSARASGDKA